MIRHVQYLHPPMSSSSGMSKTASIGSNCHLGLKASVVALLPHHPGMGAYDKGMCDLGMESRQLWLLLAGVSRGCIT